MNRFSHLRTTEDSMSVSDNGNVKIVRIRNRDIPALGRLPYAMQAVKMIERRIEWMRERMFKVTQQYSTMPRGKGGASGYDKVLAEISEIEERYTAKLEQYLQELKETEALLEGIGSLTMRTFVEMKYVHNAPREEIMRALNLSEYAFRRAKNAIEQATDMAHVRWVEPVGGEE